MFEVFWKATNGRINKSVYESQEEAEDFMVEARAKGILWYGDLYDAEGELILRM